MTDSCVTVMRDATLELHGQVLAKCADQQKHRRKQSVSRITDWFGAFQHGAAEKITYKKGRPYS